MFFVKCLQLLDVTLASFRSVYAYPCDRSEYTVLILGGKEEPYIIFIMLILSVHYLVNIVPLSPDETTYAVREQPFIGNFFEIRTSAETVAVPPYITGVTMKSGMDSFFTHSPVSVLTANQ